jgi:hypothetical protein
MRYVYFFFLDWSGEEESADDEVLVGESRKSQRGLAAYDDI